MRLMTTRIASDQSAVDGNVTLIQEVFDALAVGNSRPFVEALADDVTLTVTGEYSWSRTFSGRESVLRDLYGYVSSRISGRNRTAATNIIGGGDWVVVEARGDMSTTDGVPYRNHYCLLYRLVGSRIVEIREYQDSVMCERVLGPFASELDTAPSR
jgi:uncharacterized protein